MTVGMDAPALDGWTPLGHPAGPPPVRTESFVIRTPRPTRTDGRLQTTTGTRPAMRSGRGGRPPGCPLAPSSRPSKVSILDGCPGGCPNGCPANGSGASIPTACRAWKVQENSMSGPWRSARRRLAPTTRPWPAIRGNLDVVLQALKDAPPEGLPRTSRDIPRLWPTTASCSSTSCRSSPGPRARRSVNRSRRARSRSPGP
jgi:hypothetical protein